MEKTDALWEEIGRQMSAFDVLTSHNSDAFSLLAAILAYYESRGTAVGAMLASQELLDRVRFYVARADQDTREG